MQFSKNTSIGGNKNYLSLLVKSIIILSIIIGIVVMLSKIDFPSPNNKIEKIIQNEKFRIVK